MRSRRSLKPKGMISLADSKTVVSSVLAIVATVSFVGTIYMLHQHEVHPSARDIVMVLCGVMAGIVKDVYGYYFGSSAEEKKPEV